MSIMIIVAHPDDEVLGCGGTIARHTADGTDVQILFVADGEGSRANGVPNSDHIALREDMALRAADVLGTKPPVFLRFQDNRLDTIPFLEVVQAIEGQLETLKPSTVYTHAAGDMNVDHRVVHQAVRTALRPTSSNPVQRLLAFEVPSATDWGGRGFGPDFAPTCAIDVSAFADQKHRALRAYGAEMRAMPHPRSYEAIDALMTLRGAAFGMGAAETFELIYETVR